MDLVADIIVDVPRKEAKSSWGRIRVFIIYQIIRFLTPFSHFGRCWELEKQKQMCGPKLLQREVRTALQVKGEFGSFQKV